MAAFVHLGRIFHFDDVHYWSTNYLRGHGADVYGPEEPQCQGSGTGSHEVGNTVHNKIDTFHVDARFYTIAL